MSEFSNKFCRRVQLLATICGLLLASFALEALAQSGSDKRKADAKAAASFRVPHFRHIDPTLQEPPPGSLRPVRFLADDNFPPYSYKDNKGALTGFNIALVSQLCKDLRLKCEFIIRPWHDVLPALKGGEGDAILSGIRRTEEAYRDLDFTRAYYRTLARFVVRVESSLEKLDIRTLAGKRLGVKAGSSHEAFLKRYFPRSVILSYVSRAEGREALRTGAIDALFGDATQLMFWLASAGSRNCCRFAAGAYTDPEYFSSGLAIAVKRGDSKLRKALDYGLDRLQTTGTYARIYRRFFPRSPW